MTLLEPADIKVVAVVQFFTMICCCCGLSAAGLSKIVSLAATAFLGDCKLGTEPSQHSGETPLCLGYDGT